MYLRRIRRYSHLYVHTTPNHHITDFLFPVKLKEILLCTFHTEAERSTREGRGLVTLKEILNLLQILSKTLVKKATQYKVHSTKTSEDGGTTN